MATAAKKKPGTSVAVWQQQMAQAAKAQAAAEVVTGSFKSINTRGGILSVDDTPIKGNELRVIVLASAFENQHYQGSFNPNEIQQPVCFSLSLDGEDMQPHENSAEKQCDTCEACELNQMGSADTGRGKACKNIRRLLVVTEDALESADAMTESEARLVKVPVTSTKNWAKYVNRIVADFDRPTWGVVTLLSLMPDAKTQFKMTFQFEELIEFTQETYDAMQAKIADLNKDIIAPYTPPSEESDAPAARRTAAKKPAAKKAVPGSKGFNPKVQPGKRKF